MDNANSPEYLNKIKNSVIENLSRTKFAPSTQMTDVPPDIIGMDDEADAELDDLDEDENPDARHTQRRWDKYVEKDGELSESEDEAENQRNGVLRQPGVRRRRNIMDYQNPNAVPDDPVTTGTPSSMGLNDSSNGVANPEKETDMKRADGNIEPEVVENGASVGAGGQSVDKDVEMVDDNNDEKGKEKIETDETERNVDATDAAAPEAVSGDVDMDDGAIAAQALAVKEEAVNDRMEADTNAEAATELVKAVDEEA